jgi:hypothetical protein
MGRHAAVYGRGVMDCSLVVLQIKLILLVNPRVLFFKTAWEILPGICGLLRS